MNCTSCGTILPAGATSCPVCGTPTPYNVSPPAGSYDPTVAAPPYGTPPTPSMPPTGYGIPSYGTSPQDPYSNPSTNPYSGQSGYAPPPPPPMQPVQPQPYGPGQFGPSMQVQPPKPKSKLPLILGITGGVLLLLCVGACALFYVIGKNASTTTTTSTPTTTSTSTANGTPTTTNVTPAATGPSGNAIVPSAAAIITSAQSATGIDGNLHPTGTSTTFTVNKPVYITFNLKLSQTGYIQSKWYVDNVFGQSKILTVDKIDYTDAYFVNTYKIAATGTVELYWCTKSDCSDGQLAAVVTFTVGSSAHIQSPGSGSATLANVMDRDRRV